MKKNVSLLNQSLTKRIGSESLLRSWIRWAIEKWRTVGNEEQDAWRDASVHGALEKFSFVEQQVQMAGREGLRILEAVDVIDVLVENTQR